VFVSPSKPKVLSGGELIPQPSAGELIEMDLARKRQEDQEEEVKEEPEPVKQEKPKPILTIRARVPDYASFPPALVELIKSAGFNI
jgi:hypothetical protein